MGKRLVLPLLCLLLLVGCGQKPRETDILDYWREIYDGNLIEEDGVWFFAEPHAALNKETRKYEMGEGFRVPLTCEQDPEVYDGDLFALRADISAWKETGTVPVILYSQVKAECGTGFSLEFLLDGTWYPLNNGFSYPTVAYGLSLGGEWTLCTLSEETLAHWQYHFDEDRGLVREEERKPVPLRPGHYRLLTTVRYRELKWESCTLCTEFTLG